MATAPRNFLYLALLGVVLLTIAIVVRSGMLARKDNPRDRPINSAMREAMEESGRPQLSTQDAMLVAQNAITIRTRTSQTKTKIQIITNVQSATIATMTITRKADLAVIVTAIVVVIATVIAIAIVTVR